MSVPPREDILRSGQAIEVSLHGLAEIDDEFRTEWRELENNLEVPNPFFFSWFLEPAMKYLAPEGRVRLCVMRRNVDGLLLGLVPLITENTYAKLPVKRFEVWMHHHCYNGLPLMRTGFATDIYGALIDWIDRYPEGARFLRFVEHPLITSLEQAINEACAGRDRMVQFQNQRERAVLTGGQPLDEVVARSFNGKKRKELRRQARRMAELGQVELECTTDDVEILSVIDDFVALEMTGWKGMREEAFPIGRNDKDHAFFNEAMRNGARVGAVTVEQISLSGKSVAMLFLLQNSGQYFAFKIAHDEALKAFSPGVQVLTEVTKKILADPGMQLFDSCARSGHPVADSLWRERMTVAKFNLPAGGVFDTRLLQFCAWIERCKNAILSLRKLKSE